MSSKVLQTFNVVVHEVWEDGRDVRLLDLRSDDGAELPAFTAGAHIDIYTDGAIRQYSLCNSTSERHRYLVAVALDPDSRGGSRFLHQQVNCGDILKVSPPRNHFALSCDDSTSVLIAGGIGITPLLAMIQALEIAQRPWILHYAVKSECDAPAGGLLNEIAARSLFGKVHTYASVEHGDRMSLQAIRDAAPEHSHFYCCGPSRLLDDFDQTFQDVESGRRHSERFTAEDLQVAKGGFQLILARTGLEVTVPEDKTILQVLKEHKINVAYACEEGLCGSCEVAVLDGEPDHRDGVLSDAEKQSNRTMMTCCSGAKSKSLTLDI